MAAKAFISYSHADAKMLERLHKHLAVLRREGTLPTWTDHQIVPGDNLNAAISTQLELSNVFIAMVSPDYLDSQYCYEKEFSRALELSNSGQMRIVPVILEPCDWLSSPLRDFIALPKDGSAVSGFTNQNNAFLDVVTGLRRVIASLAQSDLPSRTAASVNINSRKPRIKQDFDAIERAEYADKAFETIRDYFRTSCAELSIISDGLRAKFEEMSPSAFTCTVVNRGRRDNGEAHITFHNNKSRGFGHGDISYVNQRHAGSNMSNGSIIVEHDDYQLFLNMDRYNMSTRGDGKIAPHQAAERLWEEFVKHVGIDYS